MPPKSKKKRGKYTPPFTPAQKKAIAASYRKGRKGGTLIGLSKKYKCSTSKVRKALKEQQVTMRPRGPVAKAKKAKKPKAVNVKVAAAAPTA